MRRTVLATFIDANIVIYAAGRAHPLKQPCSAVLALIAQHEDEFITDAEVLQELVHVYLSRGDWQTGRDAFWRFVELMTDRVESVFAEDTIAAARLADTQMRLDSRDLLHVAVMRRLGVTRIVSADTGFDAVPEIERLDPARFDQWRDSIPDPPA